MRKVIVSLTLLFVTSISFAQDDFSYIHPHMDYAKQIAGQASPANSNLQKEIRQAPDFGKAPKSYEADKLKSGGQDMGVLAEQKEQEFARKEKEQGKLTAEQERERAINKAVLGTKEEVVNIHRHKYNVSSLAKDKKAFSISKQVFKEPIGTINNIGEAECKVSDKEDYEKIEPIEYEVEIEDTRLTSEKVDCEEDDKQKFYCDHILKPRCIKTGNECATGGITPKSVSSDLTFEFKPAKASLTLGTIGDNYWSGYCAIYDRTTKFEIKNLKDITEFKLKRVEYDDYLHIELNGQLIYNGPKGGEKLEIVSTKKGKKVDTGSAGIHDCELSTSWKINLDIDLLPYLIEGENVLFTRTQVTGGGEFWLKISAKQYCCSKWEEKIETDCPHA